MKMDQPAKDAGRGYFAVFDGGGKDSSLADLTSRLLERQKRNWPALADGYAALENAFVREVKGESWSVLIQCNPRRIVSSGANLDPEAIKKRRCFLCPANLPAEQEAILYRQNYNLLCNPAPIFPGHLTIAAQAHVPQALRENVETLFQLAFDLGPAAVVFYNGPRAGASAPDHLHFQAAPAGSMPIEDEALTSKRGRIVTLPGGVDVFQTMGLARGVLVIQGKSALSTTDAVRKIMDILEKREDISGGEPSLNIFCSRKDDGWRVLLFPRIKHRPDIFFRGEEERIVVSPGAADMGGVIIAPRERDFAVLTAAMVAEIYREVAWDDAMTGGILAEL